jgi:outer membrane protein
MHGARHPVARRLAHEGGTRRVRRRLIACAVAALLGATTAAPAQTARIGYVNMARLLDNAPQIQAGREALAREFAERDAALKLQEARLAELEAELGREAAILPRSVAEARQFEVDTLRRGIEGTRKKMRDDLNTRSNEELSKRWPEVHDAVIEYAREQGYDLVVEEPVLYASAAIDITDEVLERLRRAGASAPVAPR